MNLANEIYQYPRKVEKELFLIRTQLRKEDSEVLLKYYRARVAEGLSQARILKCLNTLKLLSKISPKPFAKLNKDDVVEIIATIEQRDVSVWTKAGYKTILKKFFQWLKDSEYSQYPDEVRWIRVARNVPSKVQKKDLLTDEELRRLSNPKWRRDISIRSRRRREGRRSSTVKPGLHYRNWWRRLILAARVDD